ncbi:N-acetylneuraminate synthase family protein [Phaeocystidibacter luteus]|uniref:N-acetylneuraminate synthase n=1 Tax=Phaeocystidibacter luteus TaxID=911197 RepID=A0A6N6RL18_9FLAO|nr:N-acetylneuraminate synthase family protein [Phaeocystidibacter luteus]KAB2814327.1 N-acetylneuraminate synthase [Phaeocystidibacter luteus]
MDSKKAPVVIAEIGCNHMGSMELAKELVTVAATFCKADIVKFQKRNSKELLTEEQYNAPHPNPINSFGDTYGAHREFLEFDKEQHRELMQFCDDMNIEYSTSVWDVTSAREMIELNPRMLKVPSACNNNFELLGVLADEYEGEVHLSFGMTTHEEEQQVVDFFKEKGRAKDLVIYSCTSGYPVPFEDICLLEISRLKEAFEKDVKAIGFSGHHLGIAADIAAITLGAEYVERHYTLDRTWKGTDHSASLEPDGMRKLTRDVKNVFKALTYKSKEILPIEQVQRDKLKWREQ